MMNSRRAQIIAAIVVVGALLIGAFGAKQLLFSGASTVSAQALKQRAEETTIFNLINQRRLSAGLSTFKRDPKLDALARAHSHDMLIRDYFAHDAPGGPTFAERFHRISPRRGIGEENIAWGTGYYGTATGLVRLWMTSPEHRANILNPAVHRIGVGISIGSYQGQRGAVIGTQDFSN